MGDVRLQEIGRNMRALAREMHVLGENLQHGDNNNFDSVCPHNNVSDLRVVDSCPHQLDSNPPFSSMDAFCPHHDLNICHSCSGMGVNHPQPDISTFCPHSGIDMPRPLNVCIPHSGMDTSHPQFIINMCMLDTENVQPPERDFGRGITEWDVCRNNSVTTTTPTTATTTVTKQMLSQPLEFSDEETGYGSTEEDLCCSDCMNKVNSYDIYSIDTTTDSRYDMLKEDLPHCAMCDDASYKMNFDSEDENEIEAIDEFNNLDYVDNFERNRLSFSSDISSPEPERTAYNFRVHEAPVRELPNGTRHHPDPSLFHQVIDVSDYVPEDIKVVITDGAITILADHVEFDHWAESGVNMYSDRFCDRYSLPRGTDPDSVQINLTPEGLLVIEAPLPEQRIN